MKIRRLFVATAWAGQNSEPRSRGGKGGNNYNSHAASLPTKHAANKNKDRPFHKTLRNYYENVRLEQLHNVHCALCQWIYAFYHLTTNHHENHQVTNDSLTVFKYFSG